MLPPPIALLLAFPTSLGTVPPIAQPPDAMAAAVGEDLATVAGPAQPLASPAPSAESLATPAVAKGLAAPATQDQAAPSKPSGQRGSMHRRWPTILANKPNRALWQNCTGRSKYMYKYHKREKIHQMAKKSSV